MAQAPDSSLKPELSHELSSGLTNRSKSFRSRHNIAESYSKIRLVNIQDNDRVLMTQARIEKTKRENIGERKQGTFVKRRIDKAKHYLMHEDPYLAENLILESVKLQAVVSFSKEEFVCLERTVSVAKVIENFIHLYVIHFENERHLKVTENSENKLYDRVKLFLTLAKSSAFEIKVTTQEQFTRFLEVDSIKRPFLEADTFFETKSLEAIVLTYLLLDYKISRSLQEFKRLASQLDLLTDNEVETQEKQQQTFQKQASMQEEARSEQQKILDQIKERNDNLKERVAKMREDMRRTREGITERGDFSYNSKYLKMITMCLENKDELFVMDEAIFDKMIDFRQPQLQHNLDFALMQPDRAKVYKQLLTLREIFADEVMYFGNDLKSDLGLFSLNRNEGSRPYSGFGSSSVSAKGENSIQQLPLESSIPNLSLQQNTNSNVEIRIDNADSSPVAHHETHPQVNSTIEANTFQSQVQEPPTQTIIIPSIPPSLPQTRPVSSNQK